MEKFAKVTTAKEWWKQNGLIIVLYALFYIGFNRFVYILARLITHTIYSPADFFDFSMKDIDDKIPLISWTVIPYLLAYIYWLVMPVIVLVFYGKKVFYQLTFVSFFANILYFVLIIAVPTKMTLYGPDQVISQFVVDPSVYPYEFKEGTDIFTKMLINIVYSNDLPDNLAPSGHVMCTWLIFMACRNKTAKGKYNYWLYTITLIYGVWMFFNILTVRQHYIIDGIMSIALCEICWVLFIKTNFWVFFANGSDKLSFASAYHHDGYFTSYGKNQNNVYVNHYLKLGKCMTWILASLFCAIWVYFLLTSVLGDPFKQFWKWTSFSI